MHNDRKIVRKVNTKPRYSEGEYRELLAEVMKEFPKKVENSRIRELEVRLAELQAKGDG